MNVLKSMGLVVGVTLLLGGSARAGLDEKREMEKFTTKTIPGYQAQIKKACGIDLPIEPDWSNITTKDDIKNTFIPLDYVRTALVQMCKDQLGKDAAAKGVKKVIVKNGAEKEKGEVTFKEGVVTVTCNLPKRAAGCTTATEVQKAIEAGL